MLLDNIARTMLATMAGEPPAEFIVVLGDTVDVLNQTAARARRGHDAIGLLTDAYAGFEALLFEIDFVVSDLPVDDPRRSAERCRIRRGDRDHHGGVYVSNPLDLNGRTAIVTGGRRASAGSLRRRFSSTVPR